MEGDAAGGGGGGVVGLVEIGEVVHDARVVAVVRDSALNRKRYLPFLILSWGTVRFVIPRWEDGHENVYRRP